MIRPVRMAKFQALVHDAYLNSVLQALGHIGTLHVTEALEEVKTWEQEGLLRNREASQIIPQTLSMLARIDRLIDTFGVRERAVEGVAVKPAPFEDVLTAAGRRVMEMEEAHKKLSEAALVDDEAASTLHKLMEDGGRELLAMRETLRRWRGLEEVKQKATRTEYCSLVEGWVPRDVVEETVRRVIEASAGYCVIDVTEPEIHEHPPSVIRHPHLLETFQMLTTSYGVTSYHELNPMLFSSVTFPIIFGLMFADAGQGLLLILLGLTALYVRQKVERPGEITGYILKNGWWFIMLGSCSILGGFLFDEFFGFHGIFHPIWEILHFNGFHIQLGNTWIQIGGFNPVLALERGDLMPMFKFSIFVGALHISLGLVLNLIGKLINKEFKEALVEPFCWLWFYIGLIHSLFTYKYDLIPLLISLRMPDFLYVTAAIVVPLVLMLIGKGLTEGFMEGFSFTFEAFVSSLGNTVSYGRIMALLLSHAMMSSMFITLTEGQGIGLQLVAIIAGTFLVMVLEGLIIFVHTVRLHWVEWFSKFYKGEGVGYKPFKL